MRRDEGSRRSIETSPDERIRRQRNIAELAVRKLLAGAGRDVRVYGAGVTRTGDRAGQVGVGVFARSDAAKDIIEKRLRAIANLSDEEWMNGWAPFGRSGSDLVRVYPHTGL